MVARLGDNRKIIRLLHKTTEIPEVSETIGDINGVFIKAIKDHLRRCKEFLEIKLNHDVPSVVLDIIDSPIRLQVRIANKRENNLCNP